MSPAAHFAQFQSFGFLTFVARIITSFSGLVSWSVTRLKHFTCGLSPCSKLWLWSQYCWRFSRYNGASTIVLQRQQRHKFVSTYPKDCTRLASSGKTIVKMTAKTSCHRYDLERNYVTVTLCIGVHGHALPPPMSAAAAAASVHSRLAPAVLHHPCHVELAHLAGLQPRVYRSPYRDYRYPPAAEASICLY